MSSNFLQQVSSFEFKIKRKEIVSSYDIAQATLQLIEKSFENLHEKDEIFHALSFILNDLVKRFPREHLIQNICSHVRHRLETDFNFNEPQLLDAKGKESPTNFKKVPSVNSGQLPSYKSIMDLFLLDEEAQHNHNVFDLEEDPVETDCKVGLTELFSELMSSVQLSYTNISKQALNFLCKGDVVLTLGYSKAVLNFLASSHLNPTVLLPERAPEYDGHRMAKELKNVGINAIVIQDAAVFALLPKVQKIIVAARFVLANGGIISHSLAEPLALAAKHHSTPFIVLYWQMKLTGAMPSPNISFDVLEYPNGINSKTETSFEGPVLMNPSCDYVPPELITLMISQSGAHSPSDVFSLVQSNYQQDSI